MLAGAAASIAIAGCSEPAGPIEPITPATPTGVTVAMVTSTSARISWTPNAASDAVIKYNVYRNGALLAESVSPSYVDNGLVELTTYRYSVAALGQGGTSSARSAESPTATITPPDATLPLVSANTPAAGSTGVASNAAVTATFNEPMDPSTITVSTFSLRATATGAAIPGAVTYVASTRTAEFRAASALASNASVTATVSTGAKDAAGNALAVAHTWTFTVRDELAPVVTSSLPVSGASGVSTSATVVLTFSEAMDASTMNSGNITLRATSSGVVVTGTVAYNSGTNTATFTPGSALAAGVGYTITVSTAVKDAAGNALAAAYSSSFTTATPVDSTRPTVTQVSPSNGATGVVVSDFVTVTFSEPMNPATINAGTVVLSASGGGPVAGVVTYNAASNSARLTPVVPLSAGASYSVTITTGVADLAGNTLASVFTSTFATAAASDVSAPVVSAVGPTNGATGVALGTSVSITFNEALNAGTVSSASVTLSGPSGVVASNVGCNSGCTVVTLTPSAPLTGNTAYAVTVATTVADVAGNTLAAAFTSSFTTLVSNLVAPTVLVTGPAAGETGVRVNKILTATFSTVMDPATINSSTFTVRNTATGAAIEGIVTYNGGTNTAGFNFISPLVNNTNYTATISTGARDTQGTPLAANVVFSFTTIAQGDLTPPGISSVSPSGGATGVATSATVTIVFNEAIDPSTVTTSTVTLSAGGAVAGAVAFASGSNTATFTPSSPLAQNTTYTLTVTTGVRDLAGNALASNFTVTFTTVAPAGDNIAPTIVSFSPANREKSAPASSPVTVVFSEPLNPATVNSSTFKLIGALGEMSTSVTYDAGNNSVSFAPTGGLLANNCYLVNVTTGVKDAAGNSLASDLNTSFTTSAAGPGPSKSACGHWGGTSSGEFQIHLHFFLSQTGNDISRRPFCSISNVVPECRMYAYNQRAADVMGLPAGDPNAAQNVRVTAITGNYSEPGTVTLQLTLENGRVFGFTGTIGVGPPSVVKTLEGFITGQGITGQSAPIKMDWYPDIQ